MKRIKLLTVAAVLITLVAASCGNAPKPTTSEEDTTQQATDEQSAIDDDAPNPAPPPPAAIVGTWKAPIKPGGYVNIDFYVAFLEIHADGTANLYMGDNECDQLYEIYGGTVLALSESADKIELEMEFGLQWYVYESEDGDVDMGVPDTYKGVYTLRLEQNGNKQILHLKANADADPLFGNKEYKMERTQRKLYPEE